MTQTQQTTTGVDLYSPRLPGHVEKVEGAVLRNEDLVLPILRIVQDQSDEGTAGTFHRGDTGEEYQELLVVPLAIQPTRTKFPPGKFSREVKPECWSDNDMHPSDRPRNEDGGAKTYPLYAPEGVSERSCMTCEHRVSFSGSENREKGMCLPSYMAAFMDVNTFETYLMRLQSFNTRLARVFGAKAHMRSAAMRLWLSEEKNDQGHWYALRASAQRKLEDDELEVVRGAFDELRGRMSNIATTDEEADSATVVVAPDAPQEAAPTAPPSEPTAPAQEPVTAGADLPY